MDHPPDTTTPSSLRVLIRTSSSSSSSSSSSAPPKPPSSTLPPPLPEGVVVVGFLGSSPRADVTHLINRILDANVFGSGDLDRDLPRRGGDRKVEEEEWFRDRKISYFYAEEKGVVFLQFSAGVEAVGRLRREGGGVVGLGLEEREAGDLRGFLFMFLVCHVIIFLHEGLHFDTNVLKKFRMLQGAKNALAPFIRTQVAPVITSKALTSLSRPVVPATSSRSPVRAGSGRHGSAVSLMSGSGSHPSILPGQCTPVILFVFLGEILDGSSSLSNVEDAAVSSPNQSSSLSGARPSLALKGPNSVVMLARPISRTEGGSRKKLLSALDSQIRFLIKKCRTLVGTESSGSRGVGSVNSLPLFTLDTSRAVALLDRTTNCRGKSLDYVTNLLENALNSKTTSDVFMLENHNQNSNVEDVQAIKDFIYRQSDSLRGKGALPTNASSGSASGVGIVAAAAAAAAASAAATGKTLSAPKLPTMESWTSISNLILSTLLSVRHWPVEEIGHASRMSIHINATGVKEQNKILTGNSHAEAAISCLESSRGLNLKFSMSWCQRALPAAKDVYLKDLPACYPTSIHKSQLRKALHAFQLMVKGPAVPLFVKKLEDECTSIWEAGRQLCDAVSLTGKPCMHQRHNVDNLGSSSTDYKQHSSGYVFLHACACGRSRRFRDDPFNFDAANVSFNCFPNCENFLPSLALPKGSLTGPLGTSWSLVRLGGSRYYDTSKGLLQSGFCYPEKYLSKWTIRLEQQKENADFGSTDYVKSSNTVSKNSVTEKETRKDASVVVTQEVPSTDMGHSKKVTDNVSAEGSNIRFGRGFPSVMKKAFSEVVAGTNSVNLSFPPLQQKKQPKGGLEKAIKQVGTNSQNNNQAHVSNNQRKLDKAKYDSIQDNHDEYACVQDGSNDLRSECEIDGDPFLQIGNNVVPLDSHVCGKITEKSPSKKFNIHVGFEHECPHGHRFLLSEGHLKNLGPKHLGKEQYQSNSTGVLGENHPNDGLSDDEHVISLLNRNLPIYMNCPHCKSSIEKRKNVKFASTVSQLQRIFVVTPPFPVVLATCPTIQFEKSCLPTSVLDPERQSRFSLGCRVILPPESFLTFRLPFVYGVQVDDKSMQPMNYVEQHPERTAWLVKGTTLQVVSKEFNPDGLQMQ